MALSSAVLKPVFWGVAAVSLATVQAYGQTSAPENNAAPTDTENPSGPHVMPAALKITLPPFVTRPAPVPQFRDTTETVAGKAYTVSARVHSAFADAKLPKDALIATCARESSCEPGAVNPHSKACGLFQLMTDERTATLYEAVYNYGAQYGYAKEAAMVRRELLGHFDDGAPRYGYYPVSPAAKKHLVEKCLDPEFNTKMHEGYTLPKVLAFEEAFGRAMTYGDLAGMNNWGDKGWKMIVEQVESDARRGTTTPARTFFAAKQNIFGDVSANASMFRTNGRAISITEAYRKLVAHGGDTVITVARDAPAAIAMTEALSIAPQTVDITPLSAHLFHIQFRR